MPELTQPEHKVLAFAKAVPKRTRKLRDKTTPAKSNAKPTTITQAEIILCLQSYKTSKEIAISIRRRMNGGAKVEEGDYHVKNKNTPLDFSCDNLKFGMCVCGLDIGTEDFPAK